MLINNSALKPSFFRRLLFFLPLGNQVNRNSVAHASPELRSCVTAPVTEALFNEQLTKGVPRKTLCNELFAGNLLASHPEIVTDLLR